MSGTSQELPEPGAPVRITAGEFEGKWGWYQGTRCLTAPFHWEDGYFVKIPDREEDVKLSEPALKKIGLGDLSAEEVPDYLEADLLWLATTRDFLEEFCALSLRINAEWEEKVQIGREYLEDFEIQLAETTTSTPEIEKLRQLLPQRKADLEKYEQSVKQLVELLGSEDLA